MLKYLILLSAILYNCHAEKAQILMSVRVNCNGKATQSSIQLWEKDDGFEHWRNSDDFLQSRLSTGETETFSASSHEIADTLEPYLVVHHTCTEDGTRTCSKLVPKGFQNQQWYLFGDVDVANTPRMSSKLCDKYHKSRLSWRTRW